MSASQAVNLNLAQVCGGKSRLALAMLCTPPLPRFFFPLPTFLASCSCTTPLFPACHSPPHHRSVTGEFPELITGGYPGEQQGSNHLQAEGVQGECLITFSTAWLKTAHKSLVHMVLATRTCMDTCTVVNTAIRYSTQTLHINLGSYEYQYSCFPQRNFRASIFMTCLHFIDSKLYEELVSYKYFHDL